MGVAREDRAADGFSASLAGLQAGMLATLSMLAWLGLSAVWERSSFWTAENLLASTLYGGSAIRAGFARSTISGLALYLLLYSVLGCLFAVVVRGRLPRVRLLLVSVVLAVGWYYLSFHGIWKTLSPLVTLLHAERPTLLGHVLYGVMLAQYPRYLPRLAPATPQEVPVAAGEIAEPQPAPSVGADSRTDPPEL